MPKSPAKEPRVRNMGRVPMFKGKTAREAREYLSKHSQVIENLTRMALGKPRKSYGPGGKSLWVETKPDEQLEAMRMVLARLIPELKSTELTGDPEAPLATKDVSVPLKEVARRAAYIISASTTESGSASASAAGTPGGRQPHGDTPHHAAPPSGDLSPCAGAGGAGEPVAAAGRSQAEKKNSPLNGAQSNGMISAEPDKISHPEKTTLRHLEIGECARVGGYIIEARDDGRSDVPTLAIFDDSGTLLATNFGGGGFDGAMGWIAKQSPDLDLTDITIAPIPDRAQRRPDERVIGGWQRPQVLRRRPR